MPIGVAYNAASAGNTVWVVYSGKAYVLAKPGVSIGYGHMVYCSDTAGVADSAASVPAATHFKEIGHSWEAGSAGGLVLVNLHFRKGLWYICVS